MEDNIVEKLKLKIAISEIQEENNARVKKNFISKKIGIVACACIIVISGITYAKDIENYFKSLFTNSTEAIDMAVENGYVQKEEMDFVYDKDIGVKVDNLVIDDLNLAISFSFESEIGNLKSIRFNDFTITNDNKKVIYRSVFKSEENIENLPIYSSMSWGNMPERTSETTFTDSILIGLREHEEFNELLFDIKSIDLTYQDDRREVIEGNWNFNVSISDDMRNNTKIKYTLLEETEDVKSATAIISPTGMIVEVNAKRVLGHKKDIIMRLERGEGVPAEEATRVLIKYNNENYIPETIEGGVFENDDGVFPITSIVNCISVFSEIVNEFEVHLVSIDSSITLVKE